MDSLLLSSEHQAPGDNDSQISDTILKYAAMGQAPAMALNRNLNDNHSVTVSYSSTPES